MPCKNNSLDINPGHSPRNREDAARHLLHPSPPENHTATIPQGYPAYPGKPRQIIWGTDTPLRLRGGGIAPHSSPLGKRSSSSCCAMAPWLAHGIAPDPDDLPVDTSRIGFTKSLARSGLPAR